ncbi:MAG: EamA family transporter [Bacteroidota bacterium]
MRQFRGYLMVAGAALFWGVSATAAKALLAQGLDTVLLVQTRATFAAAAMAGYLALARPALLRVRREDLWRLALLGTVGVAGSNITYYFTIREGSVAIAILLQYTAPLLVMAYAAWRKEEQLTPGKVMAALIAIGGCYLAVGGATGIEGGVSPAGLVSGILSAFTFGFMTVYTRHMLARYSVWTVTCYALIAASLFWLVVNPPWNIPSHSPGPSLWMILAGFAVVSVLIPHTLFFGGLRHVVASRAIIVSTLEPVIAIVSAALFVGELLQAPQIGGAVLVIGAIVLLNIRREPGGEELQEGVDAA